MDNIDRQILNMIQHNFPVVSQPFKVIGDCVGVSERDVLKRMETLASQGFIRRLGAIFDSRALGFCSTLVAMAVSEDRIESVARMVSELNGVSHNYRREGSEYNLWFTLIASSKKELDEILRDIEDKTGIGNILDIPVVEKLKMHVEFRV